MTQNRLRKRTELIDVFCDAPSIIEHAMQGDARWAVKLPTGHTVIFQLEGDYLVARVTPEQAEAMREYSLFEVDGRERKVDPVPAIKSFIEEGERLAQERMHGQKNKGAGDDILALLKGLGLGEGVLADAMTAKLTARIEEEAQARAAARFKEEEERRAATSGEFGFVRLSERLTDDMVVGLMNTYLPDRDPATIPAAARVTLISKAAPADRALQGAIRDLIGAFEEE